MARIAACRDMGWGWAARHASTSEGHLLARYPTKPTAAALRRDIPSALSDEDIARLLVADPEFRATATCSFRCFG